MPDLIFSKLRKLLRAVDMRLQRQKYGYIDKLPADIHYDEGSLYDAIYEASCKWSHSVALDYYGTEITYKELIKKIDKTARALKALGVEKGDRVTICMPNTPEEVYMFYAISEVGAVANMIHPLSSEKEIEEYVNRAHSKVMLAIDVAYPKLEAVIRHTPLEQVIIVPASRSMDLLLRAIYWLTKGRKNHIKHSQHLMTWGKFLAGSTKFVGNPHARVDATSPAVVLYSGGTTGKPKGVLLSNLNFNSQALGAKYLVPELLKPRLRMLTFLPNFHAFGLGVCMHIPLYCGMRIVLIPQFNAKKLKMYIKKYRINILVGVPTVFEYLTRLKFGPRELRGIKGVVSGGDIVSASLKRQINDFLKAHGSKAVLQNGYGLTEAAGGMVFSPASVASENSVIGFPLPDSEVLISKLNTSPTTDAADAIAVKPSTSKTTAKSAKSAKPPKPTKIIEAGENEDGEILVRGLTVMQGYLEDSAETSAAFVTHHGKKYLRTGDIGYKDARGVVYFRGRLKRMIITSGYNVYPSNIEEITLKCSLVKGCACIGVPDQLRGQLVKVFIVLAPDAPHRLARKELSHIYKQYLAKYEIPRALEFVDSLPTTKLGKIDYRALEDTKKH